MKQLATMAKVTAKAKQQSAAMLPKILKVMVMPRIGVSVLFWIGVSVLLT